MKALKYTVAADKIDLLEQQREEDIEFIIRTKSEDIRNDLRQIRQFFERDAFLTDILFYTFKDHLQVIVKPESYLTFILGLFQWKLLNKIEWVSSL